MKTSILDAAMEEYQYAPLQSGGQIRIMHLKPARSFDDEIHCSLHPADLGTAVYEALSYVWGDENKTGRILLGDNYLRITNNLNVALRYIRTKRKPRMLWVDAVCINQGDILERNSQVQLMGQIYEGSLHGLIWLGEADDGVSRLFRVLKVYEMLFNKSGDHVGHSIWRSFGERALENRFVLDTVSSPCSFSDFENHFDLICKLLRAGTNDGPFNQLCIRPWFDRVWTLQEVVLEPRSLVQCGSRVLNWTTLKEFQDILKKPSIQYFKWTVDARFTLVQRRREYNRGLRGNTWLMEELTGVKKLSATDPRDKVYGCAAVFVRKGWQSPMPDYTTSTASVYIAATRSWISLFNRLNVLGLAATTNSLIGLPSWVIDWTQEHENEQAFPRLLWFSGNVSATKGSVFQCSVVVNQPHVDHELALSGVRVAIVQCDSVSLWCRTAPSTRDAIGLPFSLSFSVSASMRQSILDTAVSWVSAIRRSFDELRVGLLLERLAHLIAQASPSVLGPRTKTFDTVGAFLRNIDECNARLADRDSSDEAQDPTHPGISEVVPLPLSGFIQHTTLIVTDTDQVGLCFCSRVSRGDVVALAAGSDLPLVLRPVAGKEGYFTLAGLAWVSNMMEGELWPEKADRETLSTMVLV